MTLLSKLHSTNSTPDFQIQIFVTKYFSTIMILEEIESSLIKGEMEKEIDRKREW